MAMRGGGEFPREPGSEVPSPPHGAAPPVPAAAQADARFEVDPIETQAANVNVLVPGTRFERTEVGARAAAVAYLEATEEVVALAPADAASIQRTIATADFAVEFGEDAEQRMAELIAAVPGGITLRVAPIAARSVADGEDWLVSVWYVQAITLVGEGVVDDWRTANYRMRWEDNTWLIGSFESNRGPIPGRGSQPASATPIEFEAILSGYSDDGLSS